MLSLLQIRNFTIIECLDLELAPGFTAITGETGAGKSMLVDALSLLVGGRADTGSIRAGCVKAELTAVFEPADGSVPCVADNVSQGWTLLAVQLMLAAVPFVIVYCWLIGVNGPP